MKIGPERQAKGLFTHQRSNVKNCISSFWDKIMSYELFNDFFIINCRDFGNTQADTYTAPQAAPIGDNGGWQSSDTSYTTSTIGK